MTPPQPTEWTDARPEPSRWPQRFAAQAVDAFAAAGHGSQRQYARAHGLPRSTLGCWLRPDPGHADLDPQLVAFLRGASGLAWLRRLVLALFVVFSFRGAGGLRLLQQFLRLVHLDRFVASSLGSLHRLGQAVQDDLGRFADEERALLAPGMAARHIALVADENFHGGHVCLVAAEPASNFLVVEQYADRRDAATWAAAIDQALAGLPLTVLLLSTDQARGLLACAEHDLEALHLPELFHGQRDLGRPLMAPLARQAEAAGKELLQAHDDAQRCRDQADGDAAGPRRPGRPKDHARHLGRAHEWVARAAREVEACAGRQARARAALRGIADDYHPFDSETGAAVEEAPMDRRLRGRLRALAEVAGQAGLGGKAQEALARGQRWVGALVAALSWFWEVARLRVEELGLPEQAERAAYGLLLPGLYWQQAAPRARDADERRRRADLAGRLLDRAWASGGPLSRLPAEEQQAVRRTADELVGLFARSSSCVEGRNGRLALFHHGHTRLGAARLKALTAVHNYLTVRADGTTAAQRFFGQKARDAFAWLLERLPDLPRPAAKRPRKADRPTAKAA
jgi:hypothetical protein